MGRRVGRGAGGRGWVRGAGAAPRVCPQAAPTTPAPTGCRRSQTRRLPAPAQPGTALPAPTVPASGTRLFLTPRPRRRSRQPPARPCPGDGGAVRARHAGARLPAQHVSARRRGRRRPLGLAAPATPCALPVWRWCRRPCRARRAGGQPASNNPAFEREPGARRRHEAPGRPPAERPYAGGGRGVPRVGRGLRPPPCLIWVVRRTPAPGGFRGSRPAGRRCRGRGGARPGREPDAGEGRGSRGDGGDAGCIPPPAGTHAAPAPGVSLPVPHGAGTPRGARVPLG